MLASVMSRIGPKHDTRAISAGKPRKNKLLYMFPTRRNTAPTRDGGNMKTAADTTPTTDRATLGPLIKVGTAAALLDASGRKIRDMCVKGEIKAVKVGSDWRINTAAFLEQFGI